MWKTAILVLEGSFALHGEYDTDAPERVRFTEEQANELAFQINDGLADCEAGWLSKHSDSPASPDFVVFDWHDGEVATIWRWGMVDGHWHIGSGLWSWRVADSATPCREFVEDGSCIHSECMRKGGR